MLDATIASHWEVVQGEQWQIERNVTYLSSEISMSIYEVTANTDSLRSLESVPSSKRSPPEADERAHHTMLVRLISLKRTEGNT